MKKLLSLLLFLTLLFTSYSNVLAFESQNSLDINEPNGVIILDTEEEFEMTEEEFDLIATAILKRSMELGRNLTDEETVQVLNRLELIQAEWRVDDSPVTFIPFNQITAADFLNLRLNNTHAYADLFLFNRFSWPGIPFTVTYSGTVRGFSSIPGFDGSPIGSEIQVINHRMTPTVISWFDSIGGATQFYRTFSSGHNRAFVRFVCDLTVTGRSGQGSGTAQRTVWF